MYKRQEYNSESIVGVMNNGETNDENVIKNSTEELVECDNEMLMSVYEVEREWKNNVVIEWVQSCLLYTSSMLTLSVFSFRVYSLLIIIAFN